MKNHDALQALGLQGSVQYVRDVRIDWTGMDNINWKEPTVITPSNLLTTSRLTKS